MKEKITLYSLDEEEYPNIEIEVDIVENVKTNIKNMVEGKPFLAIKRAIVQARSAKAGEVVDTRPRVEIDDKIYTYSETKRTITEKEENNGAMIVTNPDGEEYVINSYEKFNNKYEPFSSGYIAIDGMKLFVRSNGNYAIITSSGEKQYVLSGSYFCVQDKDDIYGISNTAFESTYTTDKNLIDRIELKMQEIKKSRTSGHADAI